MRHVVRQRPRVNPKQSNIQDNSICRFFPPRRSPFRHAAQAQRVKTGAADARLDIRPALEPRYQVGEVSAVGDVNLLSLTRKANDAQFYASDGIVRVEYNGAHGPMK
jgi:hypothetical protein